MPAGDHEIVIGRVRHVESNGDGATPLLFWRGQYTAIHTAIHTGIRTGIDGR